MTAKFYDKDDREIVTFENVIRISYKDSLWFITFSTSELPVLLKNEEFEFLSIM